MRIYVKPGQRVKDSHQIQCTSKFIPLVKLFSIKKLHYIWCALTGSLCCKLWIYIHISESQRSQMENHWRCWKETVMCCACLFPGYTNCIVIAAGSQFLFQNWIDLDSKIGVKVIFSGVEIHSSVIYGEWYHDSLQRIYHKIKICYGEHSLNQQISLKLAVEWMNDNVNFDCLVPSAFCLESYQHYFQRHMFSQTQKSKWHNKKC